MLRTYVLIMAFLFAAAAVSATTETRDQNKLADQFLKCSKICSDCQLQCESCYKHCQTLSADGKEKHAKTAQVCADCGFCCATCAGFCARKGPLTFFVLECCSKCCDLCAASCEQIEGDEHMAACAKSCRNCAKECRTMMEGLRI